VIAATHGRGLATAVWDIGVGLDEQGGMEAWGQGSVEVWPNPTRGKFQITSTKHQINSNNQIQNCELVDLYGNVVGDLACDFEFGACLVPGAWNLEFDISRCPAGVYFVRISLFNSLIVKKIVKI